MSKIDLKMNIEYVCVECNGDGKEVKEFRFVCLHCVNINLYGDLENDNENQCPFCNGRRWYTKNVLVECKYCRGSGYRSWIDDIIRPIGNRLDG